MKKAWVSPMTSGKSNALSIRLQRGENIITTKIEVPPVEEILGRRLSLDEAVALGVEEREYILGPLSTEDLITLRDAIDSHFLKVNKEKTT